MPRSLRRLHLSAELALAAALAAAAFAASAFLSSTIWQRFEAAELEALERSALFIRGQLDDRLELFRSYADDALDGLRPSAPYDIEVGFVVETGSLRVLEVLPGPAADAYFSGYSLASAAGGRAAAALPDGGYARSGVVRAPELDAPAVYYAERRGDRLAVALANVASVRRAIERASALSSGGYVLASQDGFALVNAVPGSPAVLREAVALGRSVRMGEWYLSSLAAPELGGVLHRLTPSSSVDALLGLVRNLWMPFLAAILAAALVKATLEHRLIIAPLERISAGLGAWPERALSRPGAMARELETVYRAFEGARERIDSSMRSMGAAKEALAAANAELEDRVAERTAGLNAALEQLTAVQDRLVTQEKMAALGQLAAGVAHELNTPLAAILSAAEAALDALGEGPAPWLAALRGLPEDEAALALALIPRAAQAPETGGGDYRARSMGLKALAERSAGGREGANGLALARAAAAIGLGPDDPESRSLFASEDPGRLIELAADGASAARSLRLIRSAAEAAAGVVRALRSYSWEGEASARAVRLADQLRGVLALLRPRLKRGFSVELELDEDAVVMADFDRLNQVWINLINNALQAMGAGGTLGIRAERVGGLCRVTIRDSGPGVDPAIADRIFEPFFTTKAKGEGTGLGLDICRRLVEAADGAIYFESGASGAAFFVELPAAEPGGLEPSATEVRTSR